MKSGIVMALVFDGASKFIAFTFLPHVFNLGDDHGPMGYEFQLIMTGASLVFFLWLAQDARLRHLGMWIGFVVGGGLANVVSILSGPAGVLDFIPLGFGVANVADLFIWAGLGGLITRLGGLALKEARTS